jgi:hypothetical protein
MWRHGSNGRPWVQTPVPHTHTHSQKLVLCSKGNNRIQRQAAEWEKMAANHTSKKEWYPDCIKLPKTEQQKPNDQESPWIDIYQICIYRYTYLNTYKCIYISICNTHIYTHTHTYIHTHIQMSNIHIGKDTITNHKRNVNQNHKIAPLSQEDSHKETNKQTKTRK